MSSLQVAELARSAILTSDSGDLLDGQGLRKLIDGCRLDLDSLYRPLSQGLVDSVRPTIERRLFSLVARLSLAADALDQGAAVLAGPSESEELLVREADHRIRNSLQMVCSLLRRQSEQSSDGMRSILGMAAERVAAIGQVHSSLHLTARSIGEAAILDLASFLGDLCAASERAMLLDQRGKQLVVDVEPLPVAPALAQSLGLVVTELVANALRHAFPDDDAGTIRVYGERLGAGHYELCVEDDGIGLQPGFDLRDRSSGFGLRLVRLLADQVRARLSVVGDAGTRFTLVFPH